jgi:hypothetical protein
MAMSAFDDRSRQPSREELRTVLGASAELWDALVEQVGKAHAPITEHWNFAGGKFGWSLRLKWKDRIVLYLTPQAGAFLAGVVLGDKAVAAARARGLPASVLALVHAAPRYAEGRGIRVTVTTREDLAAVEALATVKMAP